MVGADNFRLRLRLQPLAQGGQFAVGAICRTCRHGKQRHRVQRGGGERGVDLGPHRSQPRGVDAIALGDRHRATRDAEQVEDAKVFACLRHHTIVGGDHQQRAVDAGSAVDHRRHEFLVPRHVDEGELAAAGQWREGVAQLDRHAALLFFRQAVARHAGEGTDERGLAVVDVTGGSYQHQPNMSL